MARVTSRTWPPRTTVRRAASLRTYEFTLERSGLGPVAGVDEAGRGACAGPLVVAAWLRRRPCLIYLPDMEPGMAIRWLAVLVPRISGKAVELHPALIMVVLLIGSQVAGLWGAVLAVPLTAVIRDVFKYLYLRLQDDPLDPKAALARIGKVALQLDV